MSKQSLMYINDIDDIADTNETGIKFEYSVRVESNDKDAIIKAHRMFLQSTLFKKQQRRESYFWYAQVSWFKGNYFFNFTFDVNDINLFLALRDDILSHDANKLLSISCDGFRKYCDIRYELNS